MVKDVNNTGDRIVLHVNVSKMLLDEESQDTQLLKRTLSVFRVGFEKTIDLLREHHFIYLDSLDFCDRDKLVKLVIHCCFDPPRWEQLRNLYP